MENINHIHLLHYVCVVDVNTCDVTSPAVAELVGRDVLELNDVVRRVVPYPKYPLSLHNPRVHLALSFR